MTDDSDFPQGQSAYLRLLAEIRAGALLPGARLRETELAERKKRFTPVRRHKTGWLARYQKLVTNASQGGILR